MAEETLASPLPKRDIFRVMVADASTAREGKLILIRDRSTSPLTLQVHYVRTLEALRKALEEHIFDLVLTSQYLGSFQTPYETLPYLIEAHRKGNLRGVITHNTITNEGMRFIEALIPAGVPCAYIPWNHHEPSKHLRVGG